MTEAQPSEDDDSHHGPTNGPTNGPLEAPGCWDDLYLYRGTEVVPHRPLITGDVVEGVTIVGVSKEPETVIVLTHPCAMRTTGGALVERIMVAPVRAHPLINPAQWTGFVRVMPLPELIPGQNYAAVFVDQGPVPSAELSSGRRVACLSDTGISLLHQRLVNHMVRLTVPRGLLFETSAVVLSEVDLCEEWITAAAGTGANTDNAARSFEAWIREDVNGKTRQHRLQFPSERAAIRRQMTLAVHANGW